MNLNNFDALIVLSNHMNSFGVLNSESKSRADKAAEIFKLSASKIITCGCAYREDSALKIAEAMNKIVYRVGDDSPMKNSVHSAHKIQQSMYHTTERLLNIRLLKAIHGTLSRQHTTSLRLLFSDGIPLSVPLNHLLAIH